MSYQNALGPLWGASKYYTLKAIILIIIALVFQYLFKLLLKYLFAPHILNLSPKLIGESQNTTFELQANLTDMNVKIDNLTKIVSKLYTLLTNSTNNH